MLREGMNRSLVDQFASNLQMCWTEGAPIEVIETKEHQLFDAILAASRSDIPPSIMEELETNSPQSLFYDPKHNALRKLLRMEELV